MKRWERPFWATGFWWQTWWFAPVISNYQVFQDAEDWTYDYSPTADGDVYSSTLSFAERQYDQALKLSETLDKKCDDIIRTAGIIGAIVATAARVDTIGSVLGNSKMILLSCLLLTVAVVVAMRTRAPADFMIPLEIRTALGIAEFRRVDPKNGPLGPLSKHVVEAALAASYHAALIGTSVVNTWKAKQLTRATSLLCAGVAILLIAMTSPRLVAW